MVGVVAREGEQVKERCFEIPSPIVYTARAALQGRVMWLGF
jgi:hypothetical protein